MESSVRRFNLVQQAALCMTIFLAAWGVHQFLHWQETDVLPSSIDRKIPLSEEDRHLARHAWRYFELNRLPTGLVSSAATFPATTPWDMGTQLAGMVAARELGLLKQQDFDTWMQQVLTTLQKLPLYHNELPNRAYNAKTLIPIEYGQPEQRKETGFSAIEVSRLVLWLNIIAARYPQHAAASRAVTHSWKLDRLIKDGQLMATDSRTGKEVWQPDQRFGYEQYAAYGLTKIGAVASKSLDPNTATTVTDLMGVPVSIARRSEEQRSTYSSCVTSEPYVLDGLESGFKALPVVLGARLLQAQQRRYLTTHQLTAWTANNLDQAPWFAYNCVVADKQPWQTLTEWGEATHDRRGSSTKAAIAWNMLFRTRYTERLHKGLRWLADPNQGVFAGFYEETQEPNRALALNTNGIILEALLYGYVGQPLEKWANTVH
jgi:hypothetical protein